MNPEKQQEKLVFEKVKYKETIRIIFRKAYCNSEFSGGAPYPGYTSDGRFSNYRIAKYHVFFLVFMCLGHNP